MSCPAQRNESCAAIWTLRRWHIPCGLQSWRTGRLRTAQMSSSRSYLRAWYRQRSSIGSEWLNTMSLCIHERHGSCSVELDALPSLCHLFREPLSPRATSRQAFWMPQSHLARFRGQDMPCRTVFPEWRAGQCGYHYRAFRTGRQEPSGCCGPKCTLRHVPAHR